VERVPLLGAVGPLQFDVMKFRPETEYGAECRVETAPWSVARWIRLKNAPAAAPVSARDNPEPPALELPTGAALVLDAAGSWVVLLTNAWSANYFADKNPGLLIQNMPF
jgi:peptide chain release factor 3